MKSLLKILFDTQNPVFYLKTFRIAVLGGRYGSGKTLLATKMAFDLASQGAIKRIAANYPLALENETTVTLPEKKTVLEIENAAIIYDEAWKYLGLDKSPSQIKNYLAYVRKNNTYLILPTVQDLSRLVRGVYIERIFNAGILGLPFWLYFCEIGQKRKSQFYYWLGRPSQYFGTYDTTYKPDETTFFIYEL